LSIVNAGIIVAFLIILFAVSRIFNLFDFKGSIAALILGLVIAFLGSLQWLILLIIFAVVSHLATKAFFSTKKAYKVQEGVSGERRVSNVFYAGIIAILISSIHFTSILEKFQSYHYFALFASSISVIAADTFASEIGVIDRKVFMITTLKRTKQGINGGVSLTGELAAVLGSSIIAVSYLILSGRYFELYLPLVVFISGFLGCQMDSILGAVFENRGYLSKGWVNMLASLFGVLFSLAIFLA
jgi:uncharacterized protein (TIGR00297 family)